MNNSAYWQNSNIGEEDISFLLPNLGPLLKLLSTEFKTDLGDKLAQSYAFKTTSCEILTSYAIRALVDALVEHMELPSQASNVSRNKKMSNVPQAALQAFNQAPQRQNKEVSEILPAKDLMKIFLGHENKVWFRVVLVILFCCPTGRDPPRRDRFALLQDEQKIKLLKAFMSHHIDRKNEQKSKGPKPKRTNLSHDLKKALSTGGKSHPCKIALNDLFYFLSNHSKDLNAVCKVLGPALFTPLDTRSFSRYLESLKDKSKLLSDVTTKLMLFMVNNRENIFSNRRHEYEKDIDTAIYSFAPEDTSAIKNSRLKQHLRHFFEIRDPVCKRIVVPLFEYYEFIDIARGILAKYRLLPYGWRNELETIAGSIAPPGLFDSLSLDVGDDLAVLKSSDYSKFKGSYFGGEKETTTDPKENIYVQQKLTNNGRNKFLSTYLANNKIRYLSEKTVFWNDITSVKIYGSNGNRPATKVDLIVDEFIKKQRDLLSTLKNFNNFYVNEVTSITNNLLGNEAMRALGLTKQEVRTLFKNNFKEVLVAQEKFVTTLEPLLLCKNAVVREKYKTYQRGGILFSLFIKCEKLIIKGFQNYNINYSVKTETLQRLQDEVLSAAAPSQMYHNESKLKKHLNFIELWEEISSTKSSLMEKKLGTILYLPIQAVPQYKIFFERILKTLGENYEHRDLGLRAMKVAENISTTLDKKLKTSKDKLSQLLGGQ